MAERVLISVVIPTLNEAGCVQAAIASADGEGIEVIVADGGSEDGTVALAQAAGARVIASPDGRALQQNHGAAVGHGDAFLFLHADTLLPPCWAEEVRAILADPAVALGAFKLSLAGATRAERVIAWAANRRAHWLGLPYGDQALFLRRETFDRLGGFQPLPIMEDWDLARRARRHGRVLLADAAVVTSPRRWRRLGPVRTTLINAAMVAGFTIGMGPDRLARFYRSRAARSGLRSGRRSP